MLLGNTMNGVSLSTERLTEAVVRSREVIEQRLALGETREEAVSDIARESVRAGLIPIFNAMAAAGVVSLPGMMTGQILAGASVDQAVRYQILILLLIAAGTGFGVLAAVRVVSRQALRRPAPAASRPPRHLTDSAREDPRPYGILTCFGGASAA